MQIKIKRIDKTLPLPKMATPGSVAFDLYSREDVSVEPGEIILAPSNFVIKTPPGFMLLVAGRSSLAMKFGLTVRNGIGVIDQDYCGDEDEVLIQLYNFTKETKKVERGERIAQAIFVKIDKNINWKEVDTMSKNSRGGFGSTGKK